MNGHDETFQTGAELLAKYHQAKKAEATMGQTLIPDTVYDMLATRGQSHGGFGDNAKFALPMRDLLRSMPLWMACTAEQRLALDEIALKIARIVSGGSNIKEHWNDIIGYASLGLKGCSK